MMKKIKILNLYCGVGGNRKGWEEFSSMIEVTAVELNPEIAEVYQKLFPGDKVVVGDAHKYLLEHYKEFDFIWASRPCIGHSKARFLASSEGEYPPVYPDMGLYEEIIFLKKFFKGIYVVENVKPYYEPLIEPDKQISKYCFWTNVNIIKPEFHLSNKYHFNTNSELQEEKGINLDHVIFNTCRKDQVLKNCVNPKIARHIFECAFGMNDTGLLKFVSSDSLMESEQK